MANRHTLHKSRLHDFAKWLVSEGWEIKGAKGFYEVLRATKGKRTIIVYERLDAKEHCSLADRDYPIVKRFLREWKKA